tara:strand:+ start:145 stop:303 length:159 start_codon:yes stop_codon:yes gene_type:complete
MIRYYVEFAEIYETNVDGDALEALCLSVYAYSEQHVRDMFKDYDLVAIDQTA